MTKRCAYFGCMHPLFEPHNGRQKYCCHECAAKAADRSPAHRAYVKRAMAEETPAAAKTRVRRNTANNYLAIGRGLRKLPDWMKG